MAPLTAFALVMAFASVLALTGLISRRAGEATLILAAVAFMIQRLVTHWRIRRARHEGRAAIARLQSAGAMTATFGDEALSFDVDGRDIEVCVTPIANKPKTPAASFTYGRATAPRSSCQRARSPTPRRRRALFPASRAGSAMGARAGRPLLR